jgi:hypothetical protein
LRFGLFARQKFNSIKPQIEHRANLEMKDSIYDGPVRAIFRPTTFLGSKTVFLSVLGVVYAVFGFIFLKDLWGGSTIQFVACWLALPAMITSAMLVSRFSWSVWVLDTKLVIKDYSFNSLLRTPVLQEILFEEIDCIYYLEKEYNLLKNYRHKLREYKIPSKEKDYRKENLIQKYGVSSHTIETFEHSSQKGFNDYTATGVLMSLEEILGRYKVPKNEKKQILNDLKNTGNFDFGYVSRLLSLYAISQDDMDNLKDMFSDLGGDVLTPFLLTRLSVAGLERAEKRGRGCLVVASINVVLVLSNSDGTEKVYLRRFHSLSRADWQKLIQSINEKKHGIKYLMPKLNYRNITDPDFKPGRM